MQIAKLSDLKKELRDLSHTELLAVCLRLAKYKKDNKELINYLIFESSDESSYVSAVKQDIIEGFELIHSTSIYFAKKGIRKVLRVAAKQIKYSGNKQSEAEVLICFCEQMMQMNLRFGESRVMMNLFENQLKKIKKALSTLHEDLQYDYNSTIEKIQEWVAAQNRYSSW